MRPQPRVHLAVSAQAAGVLEGLAALFAHVRPLARVLPQVVLVVGAPLEGERTVGALEGPDARVHLGGGDTGQYGCLDVYATLEIQNSSHRENDDVKKRNYPLMDGEQRGPLEALATLGAAVRPLPSVVPHVVL